MKKIASVFIAAIMMLTVPLQSVYAADEGVTKQEVVEQDAEKVEGVEKTEEIQKDDEQNDETNVEENIKENVEQEDTSVEQAIVENTEPVQEKSTELLNYIVVDKAYIQSGDVQNIIASIGNGQKVIESAILTYHRVEDGMNYQVAANKIDEDALLFEVSYEDSAETGTYKLDSIIYTISDEMYTIEISQAGIEAQYGVNKEVETKEDANVVEGDSGESTVEAEVVSFDENGNQVSENSIEEAIEGQQIATFSTSTKARNVTKNKEVVVVLDPGHDNSHPGTRGNGLKEEQLTLKIAQYCKNELEQYSGVKVYMTRTSGTCPHPGTTSTDDNAQRVAYAKSVNANVYVSIHLNSAGASANGAEVYYPNSNYRSDIGTQGKELASEVLNQLISLGLYNRGIKIRNSEDNSLYSDGSLADYYGVIKGSKKAGFPGIIIEHAFVTNASDAAFLSKEDNLKKLGIADANGIVNYFGLSKGYWETGKNGEKYYYFNDEKVVGEKQISGKWYYFDPEKDGAMTTGFYKFPSKTVYYDADGAMCYGEQQISGKWYYFNTRTGAMQTGLYNLGNKIVYYGTDGAMCYGEQQISGKWYYFDTRTGAMQTGFCNLGNKTAYYGTDGIMCYGEQQISGKWYYFNTRTGAMQTGFCDLGNKTVYYGADGAMRYGIQKIEDKTYFFDIRTGAMQIGLVTDGNGNTIYIDTNGGQVFGERKIGSCWYYFDSDNKGYMVKNDFTTLKDGRIVYYDQNGAMRYGEQQVAGKWYYFDTRTGAMQTGFYNLGNKVVYYGTDGAMRYGEQQVAGKWYYFVTRTGAMQTGFYKLNNKMVYYGTDGAMCYGEQRINGKWYYFDEITGTMAIGFCELGNKIAYYGTDGIMRYGEQQINGKWYYFDKITGAMAIGFCNLGNKIVYYGTDGAMCYGEQQIDGKWYAFNTATGAMIKNNWFNGKYYGTDGVQNENGLYAIEGASATNIEQMVRYFEKYRGTRPYESGKDYPTGALTPGGAATIEEFAKIFYEEATREGIKAEVAWTQTMLETGFLHYGGDVKIEQYNFAGIGATGGGAAGASFSNVQLGVRAQIQHLKAYANADITVDKLKTSCVDPRFIYVAKGCAPYVEWLGQKENPNGYGWATSEGYGNTIRKMINNVLES